MTNRQRIEHKHGNAARAVAQGIVNCNKTTFFNQTTNARGLLERAKRWQERVKRLQR